MASTSVLDIPTIDVSPFLAGDADGKAAVARAVAQACETVGFLVISGHGLPQTTLDQAIERGLGFFDLPQAEKDGFHPTGTARQRGYHRVATRNLASTMGQKTPPDLRESVYLGPIDDHRDHYAHLPDAETAYADNTMPSAPNGFDAALVDLYRGFERLSRDLSRIMAVALDLAEETFVPLLDRHFSVFGMHHYPVLGLPPEPGQLRAGAHTDFGAMTILAMTEGRGGLEARLRDGRWAPVQPGRGELVVNLGDMMQRWTNDRWVSTLHRVVVPEAGDAASRRLSIGYFVHPNFDAEIRCVPSCLGPGESPRYPTITAGEHIRQKIDATHKAA
ncbi:MAG: 2-oxoglutarate and iron-dependent oxygenase domain-containing protein [Thalassobaculaceae bacterium]|nr:2-oxoglutarate and iron-dependent oxygenase domain-containing protein [Thalassobaculaceae bacterium]